MLNFAILSHSYFKKSRERKVLELNDLIRAYINMHIPVRLSPKTSLYDLQKLRYVFLVHAFESRLSVAQFFQNILKMEGPRAQRPYTSVYKHVFSASFEPKDKSLRPPKAEIQNYSAGAQYNYLRKKGRGQCKRETLILAKKSYTPLNYMANGGYLTTPTLFLKYRPFMIGSTSHARPCTLRVRSPSVEWAGEVRQY